MIPEISIIIPVFRAERTLSLCIESLLKQTFTDVEIILIDDGALMIVVRYVMIMLVEILGFKFFIRKIEE